MGHPKRAERKTRKEAMGDEMTTIEYLWQIIDNQNKIIEEKNKIIQKVMIGYRNKGVKVPKGGDAMKGLK